MTHPPVQNGRFVSDKCCPSTLSNVYVLVIGVRRLLSAHHIITLSRECQRISEFHLL